MFGVHGMAQPENAFASVAVFGSIIVIINITIASSSSSPSLAARGAIRRVPIESFTHRHPCRERIRELNSFCSARYNLGRELSKRGFYSRATATKKKVSATTKNVKQHTKH